MTTIRFDLPDAIERSLRTHGRGPSEVLKEAALVELYRRREITRHQLGEGLGLGRIATDEVLRRREITLEMTGDDLRGEVESLHGGPRR